MVYVNYPNRDIHRIYVTMCNYISVHTCALVPLYVCYCGVWVYNLNSIQLCVPWCHQTFMSSAQLSPWPSARPQYLSLSNRLKGPKHPPPALLPVDPKDSYRCTWYASQTSSSLSSGKGSGTKIWIENAVCQNRNTCISGPDGSLSATYKHVHYRQSSIRSSVTGDRYRWTLWHREKCKSMIGSRMKSFRRSRVGRSCKTWTAFINMVLIYSKPSLESRTPGTAVSGDKWLLLNGVVPCYWASLIVSLSLQISFHWTMCYCSPLHYHL